MPNLAPSLVPLNSSFSEKEKALQDFSVIHLFVPRGGLLQRVLTGKRSLRSWTQHSPVDLALAGRRASRSACREGHAERASRFGCDSPTHGTSLDFREHWELSGMFVRLRARPRRIKETLMASTAQACSCFRSALV